MTLQMRRPSRALELRTTRFDGLRDALNGDLVLPGDEGYDDARAVHSAAFDRHPAAIVRAGGAADVQAAVRFARANQLPIAVRSGGHSFAGHGTADDALVIDLSRMKGLEIDPVERIAHAETGLTAGEFTRAAGAYGLAVPFGDVETVGIGGLTLGGGVGYLARKHGLTIDSLLAAEIVTADGTLVTTSADENPDLFWAIRGGGGNFGIAVSFTYRLHPVGLVYGGALMQPATRDTLRALLPVAANAPEDLTTIAYVMAAPPAPFVPADQVGRLVLANILVHASDDMAAGAAAAAPFRAVARPIADTLGPIPYPAIYAYTAEAAVPGQQSADRSVFLDYLDDAVIEAILDFMSRPTSPMAMVQFRILGGAMARVDPDATAFFHRRRPVIVTIITPFAGPATADEHWAWTESLFAALHPHATGAYANFLGAEGEARIREAYPASTHRRLAAIKRAWDPENVFRLNQNIAPA